MTDTDIEPVEFVLAWNLQGEAPLDEITDMVGTYNRIALCGIPEIGICDPGTLTIQHFSGRRISDEEPLEFVVMLNLLHYIEGIPNLSRYESRDFAKFFEFIAKKSIMLPGRG